MKEKGGGAEQGKQGFILPGPTRSFQAFLPSLRGFFSPSSLLCCFSSSLTVLAAAAVFAEREARLL